MRACSTGSRPLHSRVLAARVGGYLLDFLLALQFPGGHCALLVAHHPRDPAAAPFFHPLHPSLAATGAAVS